MYALHECTSHFSLIYKQAICFSAFLVGFITVLCIGNYFRAKRAQDRQRQRRLAKLADDSNFIGSDPYNITASGEYNPPTPTGGVQV